MAVPFQVLNNEANFFARHVHIFGLTGDFDERAATQNFKQGKFLFEDVELVVVDAEELDGIHRFEINDVLCQRDWFILQY